MNDLMKSNEDLIGVLMAISVVADNLARRLMALEREVECREKKSRTRCHMRS